MNILQGIRDYRLLNRHLYRFSGEEIRAYQFSELQKLVAFSVEHSPFYRDLYKGLSVKSLEDFQQLPTINKAFTDASIVVGGTTTLTITLGNVNPLAATLSANMTDTMPVNLVVKSPPNIRGTCTTGSITATAGQRAITYASGAAIPSGGCTIIVDVTSSTGANYTNTIAAGALQTNYGNNASPATADLKVKAPPTIA